MKPQAFKCAGGTVCGADHLGNFGVPGESINQDSFLVREFDDSIVAVVCDGCSDRHKSGIGAALLCEFFISAAKSLLPQIKKIGQSKPLAAAIQRQVVDAMKACCELCSGGSSASPKEISRVADELFLCTLVGCIVTPEVSMVLASGDGVWGVNSLELTSLGPFPNNEPPYLGYLLRGNAPATPELSVIFDIATKDLHRIAIGSDGCEKIPAEVLRRIFSKQITFENPETINRELRMLNSQTVTLGGLAEKTGFRVSPSWSERVLDDDTTLIVIEPVRRLSPLETEHIHKKADSKAAGPPHHPKKRGVFGGLFGGSTEDTNS